MKKAFSLIELLISLITISVILASLAPVFTHKLKYSRVSIGAKKLSTKCPADVSNKCALCLENECIACRVNCGMGQYKNVSTCQCENCTIANCLSCNSKVDSCDICKAGYEKNGNSCMPCQGGYYSSAGGVCKKCPKGTKSNSNGASIECINCDSANEYQDLEAQINCKTCSLGFVADNHKACKQCAIGTRWNGNSCVNCSAGSYSNSINSINCTPCPIGSMQNETGKTTCNRCNGVNEYQDSTGQTSCKTCNTNFKPNAAHTNCESICQQISECAQNQYYKNSCTCTDCPDGQTPKPDRSGCIIACPQNCKTCSSSEICTECIDGYILKNNKCEKPDNICELYDSILIDSDSGTKHMKFCLTAYNAGDKEAAIFNGIKLKTGYLDSGRCWDDKLKDNRVVCDYHGASNICSKLKEKTGKNWKLPNSDYFAAIVKRKSLYVPKLHLCIPKYSANNSFPYCGGAVDEATYEFPITFNYTPNCFWGDREKVITITKEDGNYIAGISCGAGSSYYTCLGKFCYSGFPLNSSSLVAAYSVRCVLDVEDE